MDRLCIIPCGAKKIWDTKLPAAGPYKAKYVYTGTLHRKCQAYANRFFEHWVILSAKHGFLFPDDELYENYNVSFGTKNPEIIKTADLTSQAKDKGLDRFDEVVALGGKKFTTILPQVFEETGSITYPLVGAKGIGYMLQRLNRSLNSHIELE